MTARGYHSREAARPPVEQQSPLRHLTGRRPLPLLFAGLLFVCVLAACRQDAPEAQETPQDVSATTAAQVEPPEALVETAPTDAAAQAQSEAQANAPLAEMATADPVAGAAATSAAAPAATLRLAERLTAAEQAFADGEYELVVELLAGVPAGASAAREPQAYLLLARAYLALDETRIAIPVLEAIVIEAKGDSDRALATGLLAYAYESVGEWAAAIDAFGDYIEVASHMAPYAHWRIARAYEALGQPEQAAAHLTAVDLASLPAAQRAEVLEDLAKAQREMQAYDLALASYDAILAFAEWPSYRALLAEYKAETLLEAGREDEGVAALQAVLASSPTTTAGILALRALDERGGADIDDFARAQVLYGARLYAEALETLVDADDVRARYLAARCYAALGQYDSAFAEFDDVIALYPQDAGIGDVWMAKAAAAEDNGGDPSGIYREFWRQYPDHARAPEALWLAAQSLDGQGSWMLASEFYSLLRAEYPEYRHVQEAAFRQGLMRYALGEPGQAQAIWVDGLAAVPDVDDRARWLTWLGIAAQAQGEEATSADYWLQAVEAAPESYYGRRADDLGTGTEPLLSAEAEPVEAADPLVKRDWTRLEKWVREWATESDDTERLDPADDSRLAMAVTFWEMGHHSEALTLTSAVREDAEEDGEALLALVRVTYEAGIESAAISAAETLFALAREAGETEMPEALRRVAYPAPFIELVNSGAATRSVDPLLFYALMRQESRFDPLAVSYAGARGLAQVMPSTGEWIASRLGIKGYHDDLLYRPGVSVQYGLWYLQTLLDLYDRDWIAALVAYNAGPGNLSNWTNDAPIADHDLFYETIPIQQAQDYVTLVYRQFRAYQSLYRGE